jgi:tyrosyl-tRNA synthetase
LNKLRELQELGHTVIFLIGDFTSMIGDPSGRNTTRPPLTREQIETNAKTYSGAGRPDPRRGKDRDSLQLRVERPARRPRDDPARVALHGRRMMERDDFSKRFKAGTPISVHEFLYPLMQGYDSVALQSDLELGGTDQKFNLLVGRSLQAEYGQEPQCIMTMPLLEGLDGVEKMSKSKGNYIALTDPANDMFGKLMSISDDLMWRYFDLLSNVRPRRSRRCVGKRTRGRNPRDAKVLLAKELTARFHGAAAADAGEADFNLRARGGIPDEIESVSLSGAPLAIGSLLKQAASPPRQRGDAPHRRRRRAGRRLGDLRPRPAPARRHLRRPGRQAQVSPASP